MAEVARCDFSPTLRSQWRKRWVFRAFTTVAACALLIFGNWIILHQRTMPTPKIMARLSATIPSAAEPSPDTTMPAAPMRLINAFVTSYAGTLLATARWGYIDTGGRVAIPPRFQKAKGFTEGRAAVKVDARWGYIGVTGELIVPAKYTKVSVFSDGLAPVELDGKWGFITPAGREVIPPQFQSAQPFHEGRAVIKSAGKFGCIDLLGHLIIPAKFAYISDFNEGLATAKFDVQGPQMGFIDPAGATVIPPNSKPPSRFEKASPP